MKSTILFALLTVVPLLGDDALYISPPQEREKAKATIESGHLVWRFPVVRAAVTDAVLRHDTEDKQILWLELHMAKYLDPGDHIYHFEPAPKNAEFYVRGSDIHKEGCKWAMRFDDLAAGRNALARLATAYALKAGHVRDDTKR